MTEGSNVHAFALASKLLDLYKPAWKQDATKAEKDALKVAEKAVPKCLPPADLLTSILSAAANGRVPTGKRAMEATNTLLAHMHKAYKRTAANDRVNEACVHLFGPTFHATEGQLHALLTLTAI
jgi:hypothetical protein